MSSQPKPGPVTRTGTSTATTVRVRGRDLVGELIGKYSFTEMLYFLTCDRMPDAVQVRLLDACLVTLMEHGLTPGAVIARLMADSVPEEPQVAIAAGLLAIGSVYAGTTESCAALLLALDTRIQGGAVDAAADLAREHARAKRPVPGFGHGTHKPDIRAPSDCCRSRTKPAKRAATSRSWKRWGGKLTRPSSATSPSMPPARSPRSCWRSAFRSRRCAPTPLFRAPAGWSGICWRSRPLIPGARYGRPPRPRCPMSKTNNSTRQRAGAPPVVAGLATMTPQAMRSPALPAGSLR